MFAQIAYWNGSCNSERSVEGFGKATLEYLDEDKVVNKIIIEGDFIDGFFQNGKITYPDRSKYIGNFLDNNKHGYGVHTFYGDADEVVEKYSGYHKNGKKHGQGKLEWYYDGVLLRYKDYEEGEWKYGKFWNGESREFGKRYEYEDGIRNCMDCD